MPEALSRHPAVSIRLFVEACALAAVVRVAVRFVPLTRIAAALGRFRLQAEAASIDSCLAAASLAAARVAHPTCLYRSLVAFGLLVRRSHAAAFHLGASLEDGFAAHAWVTVNGRACEPLSVLQYAPLWRHVASTPSQES